MIFLLVPLAVLFVLCVIIACLDFAAYARNHERLYSLRQECRKLPLAIAYRNRVSVWKDSERWGRIVIFNGKKYYTPLEDG